MSSPPLPSKNPYSFDSLFRGDPSHLQTIQKGVVRFDFNGRWHDHTFCYLDVDPDISRLFQERHFDYNGHNLIEDLQKSLQANPKLIQAVSLTQKDLHTKISSEILTSIQITFPHPGQDPVIHYLSACICYSFGQGSFPGEYQEHPQAPASENLKAPPSMTKTLPKVRLAKVRDVVRAYFPSNLSGGLNACDLPALIASYANNYNVSLLIREYAKATPADTSLSKLRQLICPHLPSSTLGGTNRYDISLLISEYFDEYATEQEIREANPRYWYGSDDISDYLNLVIERELGGYREQGGRPCRFLLQGNKEGFFIERGERWLVALTPAVDTARLSLPLGYFFDKSLQPKGTLLTCYEKIEPVWHSLEKNNEKILCEQLLKLLAPEYDKEVVDYLIEKLKEIGFNRKKFERQLATLRKEEHKHDLIDELSPFLQAPQAQVKILIPYNRSQSHWLTAEMQICKEGPTYQIRIGAHDPYGGGQMRKEQFYHLVATIAGRIHSLHPEAVFTSENEISPYTRRQQAVDVASCGVITAEDLLLRITGHSLDRENPYPLGAVQLRQAHIETVARYLPPYHATRNNFLRRSTLLPQLQKEEAVRFVWGVSELAGGKVPSIPVVESLEEEEAALAEAEKIKIDPREVEKQKKEVRQKGLGLEQTTGALKIFLRQKKEVHVVYSKEIGGDADVDNSVIARQIDRLFVMPQWIVFPYAINEKHQIAVVIHVKTQEMHVTDSLGLDRTTSASLKALAKALEPKTGVLRILPG
ncbi:MAG: hypothetical protein HYZ51_02565, partial [Candidatus Doudnabacteria bacterium]|nr:hypothetical protein [Candidatus Doudnabacteria bacterium]